MLTPDERNELALIQQRLDRIHQRIANGEDLPGFPAKIERYEARIAELTPKPKAKRKARAKAKSK